MKIRITLIAAISFCLSIARADEAIFAWTYTTDLLPRGRREFEQWMTARWEKEHGTYNVFDFREELEYGLTDNFQVALYLNHHCVNEKDDFPAEDPSRPGHRFPGVYETGGEDVHAGHNPATPFDSYHFESVSFEVIYRLLTPYKDPIGLALFLGDEIGVRSHRTASLDVNRPLGICRSISNCRAGTEGDFSRQIVDRRAS